MRLKIFKTMYLIHISIILFVGVNTTQSQAMIEKIPLGRYMFEYYYLHEMYSNSTTKRVRLF